MSWLRPTPNERTLLDHVKANQGEVYRLARYLGPALRIEPRLLRNARMRFLPHSDAGLEAALWRSELVESASRRAIILRGGVARLLTDSLLAESAAIFEASWASIEANTRHWPRLERLEQRLRLAIIRHAGNWSKELQEALRLLAHEPDESQRLDIARWAKHALPAMVPAGARSDEADWLMKFAAAALGDPGRALGGARNPRADLPRWLGRLLPPEPVETATVGLRWRPGVLECLPAGEGEHDLPGLTPLPAPVRITTEGADSGFEGWETLVPGGRVPVPADARHLVLETLLGARYRLSRRSEGKEAGVSATPPMPVWILFAPGDEELARLVMATLRANGMEAETLDFEKAFAMISEAGSGSREEAALISLWSENALRMLGGQETVGATLFARGLVLVMDEAPAPGAVAEGAVLDLRGWDRSPEHKLSRELVRAARGLLAGEGEDASGGWVPPDLDGRLPMVVIPGGTFLMGSPPEDAQAYGNERPQHELTISAFALSHASVTRGLYREFMDEYPKEWDQDKDDDRLPANYISWFDAVAFCNRLSAEAGLTPCYDIDTDTDTDNRKVVWQRNINGYRLPTEAEWEYACRAGTTTRWFWGDDEANTNEYAWFSRNAWNGVHPVAGKSPNPWGLYDMAGNVYEWCWDWHGAYSDDARIDPTGPSDGTFRVLRGGAFHGGPGLLRSANRVRRRPEVRGRFIGFRVACPRLRP